MNKLSLKCKLPLNIKKATETNKEYQERVKNDFDELLNKTYYFRNKPIKFKTYENASHFKEVFDHLTTSREKIKMKKGKPILKHSIDLQRLERVLWIDYILSTCASCDNVNITNQKNNCISLVCEELLYVIILEERKNYYLLTTAYPIIKERLETKFKSK